MSLPDLSIRKPVTTMMAFLGIMLLGIISWSRLPQELFPAISYPQLTIVTTYENAAPEEVETLITKIVEEAVGTVSNLKRISSTSKEGISLVTAEFNWGTNMDFGSLGVREKIDLVKERLPLGSAEPIVMKFNPFEMPIMNLSITGDKPPAELLRLSRKFIKDELEKVPGVASCNISGGLEREILVSIDQGRLRATGIAINSIVDALKSTNLNYPAGTVEEQFYEYLIRTLGEFEVVSEIRQTVVGKEKETRPSLVQEVEGKKKEKQERLVYLKDVAEIKDTFQERTSISRFNGRDNISVSILKQAGANTIQVAKGIKKRLKELEPELPAGFKIDIVYDQSKFIKKAISDVRDAACQGGLLAFLVLFLFLKRLKPALIVATSIPVSIMMAFTLMYFSGISVNMLSLGGLALGVGMLVDAGIVVIENISNHLQKKEELIEACRVGASEVSGPIWGSVLTTIVVFLPMIFVVGMAGQIFKELSLTITYSLIASLFVSLSLIPILVTIGRRKKGTEAAYMGEESEFRLVKWMKNIYGRLLGPSLKKKTVLLSTTLLVFILSISLFFILDKEFMPKIDQREFICKVNLPTGTRLSITGSVIKKIERVLFSIPDVEAVALTIGSTKERATGQIIETLGSHQAQIIVSLTRGKKKGRISTAALIQDLKKRFETMNLEGAQIEFILEESIFKTALLGSAPIAIEIKGQDLGLMRNITNQVQERLEDIPGVYGIRNSLVPPAPETKVNIIKDKAALYNLSVGSIAQAAHIALKGVVATKFKEAGREIDIRVRLRPEDRKVLSNVRGILIHSPLDIDVPLSEVAYITHGVGPSEIKRLDQQRVILITTNIASRSLDKITEDINRIISSITAEQNLVRKGTEAIEKDVSIELAGENQEMKESFKSLRFALLLSILLVYMIMAGEFESLWQPFIIMFTVPLSLIGVSWVLFITHTPISVVVLLGIIVLGGIVVDNGIVLIDKVNNLRAEGRKLYEAVIEAGRNRLRPIMMTSFTTVLGLLPLALGIGEGSELQAPMAIAVMGGLTVATLLTLFVIPALYVAFAKLLPERVAFPIPEEPKVLPVPLAQPMPAIPIPVLEVSPPLPALQIQIEKIKPERRLVLNKRQAGLIEHIKKEGKITRSEYAKLFKISVPTAARDLKELADKGILKAEGPLGPGRWYKAQMGTVV